MWQYRKGRTPRTGLRDQHDRVRLGGSRVISAFESTLLCLLKNALSKEGENVFPEEYPALSHFRAGKFA